MKKNILVLATTFPLLDEMDPEGRGGFFLHTNCLCLVQAGYNVHVLSPLRQDLPAEECKYGIRVSRFAYPFMKRTPFFNNRALYDFRSFLDVFLTGLLFCSYIKKIRKFVKRQPVDLIWANWLQVGFATYLAVGKRKPLLTSLRGSDVRNMPGFLTRLMAGKVNTILNMHADEEILGWIHRFHLQEIRVPDTYKIGSGVGMRQADPAPAKTIVVLGRLENNEYHLKHKGIGDPLFAVLRRIIAHVPDTTVYVIGDGSKSGHFRSLCADLSNNITFLGWRNEFDEYLRKASFVIGASGLAGVTLDTVPFGIPALISKYDPASFFWENERNCLVYDPLNEDNFFQTVEFALGHPELLRTYAEKAKKDIGKVALPVEEAAYVWREKIEFFLSQHPQC